jgi:hypothetical protein
MVCLGNQEKLHMWHSKDICMHHAVFLESVYALSCTGNKQVSIVWSTVHNKTIYVHYVVQQGMVYIMLYNQETGIHYVCSLLRNLYTVLYIMLRC